MVLYTGTFEAYQGLDLLFDAARLVLAKRPDARFVLAGGRPDQIAAAQAAAARAGLGDECDLRRSAPRRRDPELPGRGGPACLAAQQRHEHAAEDLSIPALGSRHCRDPAAHTHTGARRRRRDPDAGRCGWVRGRDPVGHRGSGSRAGGWRSRPAARRDEVQLRGVPGADARGVRVSARIPPRKSPGAPRE